MALSDYIPNLFGQAPATYQGLLGMGLVTPEQVEATQKQANVQGLLGAALTLAQGMSAVGNRRSAAENIINALGGGFQAAGGAYQQGIQNIAQQQQMSKAILDQQNALMQRQQTIAQQKAIENALQDPRIARDPVLSAYIRSNPNEALKMLSEVLPLQQAAGVAPSVAPSGAPSVTPSVAPGVVQPTEGMPAVEVSAPAGRGATLLAEKNRIQQMINTYSDPRFVGNDRANKIVEQNMKRLEAINKELGMSAVESYDFTALEAAAPDPFKGAVQNLRQMANTGGITPNELTQRVGDIEKRIADYNKAELDYKRAQSDYTKEAVRVAQKIAPGKTLDQLTPEQVAQLDKEMYGKDKDLRIAGRAVNNITVSTEKALNQVRAKQVAEAEDAAENYMNMASDVQAIVEVLRPYRGGKIDEFKASLGGFLPDTSLAQMSTASDFANALRAKLAPMMRAPSSGSTSDFEMRQFMSAIPSLSQYAEGRELLAKYTQKFAERASAAAQIKSEMLLDGTYSAEKLKNELKARGFEKILTKDDLDILQGKKRPEAGGVRTYNPRTGKIE